MNKYVVISDPIRSVEFALVGDLDGSIVFKTFNEVAKQWATENSSAKSLDSLKVPNGMYVSSQRKMTTSISLIFDPADNQAKSEIDIPIPESNTNFSHFRKINNVSKKINASGIHLRKISTSSKMRIVDYKAQSFKNRAKRSSVISAIRSGVGRLDEKSISLLSKSDKSIDVLAKTAGSNLVRRVAVSNFIKKSSNRLERRAISLTSAESPLSNDSGQGSAIDVAISSKARRFI